MRLRLGNFQPQPRKEECAIFSFSSSYYMNNKLSIFNEIFVKYFASIIKYSTFVVLKHNLIINLIIKVKLCQI